jgi:transposase-like protein
VIMMAKATEECIRRVVNYYLQDGQSIESTARHFSTNNKNIRNKINEIGIYDEQLHQRAVKKVNTNRNNRAHEARRIVKVFNDNAFESLNKKVSRKQLIDWYIREDFRREIQVKELINMAKRNGIIVVDA